VGKLGDPARVRQPPKRVVSVLFVRVRGKSAMQQSESGTLRASVTLNARQVRPSFERAAELR